MVADRVVGIWYGVYMQMLRVNYPNLHWIDAISRSVKHGGALALGAMLMYCVGMHMIWWRENRHEPTSPIRPSRASLAVRECSDFFNPLSPPRSHDGLPSWYICSICL